jgi:hypothetical protein
LIRPRAEELMKRTKGVLHEKEVDQSQPPGETLRKHNTHLWPSLIVKGSRQCHPKKHTADSRL